MPSVVILTHLSHIRPTEPECSENVLRSCSSLPTHASHEPVKRHHSSVIWSHPSVLRDSHRPSYELWSVVVCHHQTFDESARGRWYGFQFIHSRLIQDLSSYVNDSKISFLSTLQYGEQHDKMHCCCFEHKETFCSFKIP